MKLQTVYKNYLFTIYSKNGHLLSIENVKEILNNSNITEEELEKIRDGFRYLSEVVVDKYISEKDKNFDISGITLKIESSETINS